MSGSDLQVLQNSSLQSTVSEESVSLYLTVNRSLDTHSKRLVRWAVTDHAQGSHAMDLIIIFGTMFVAAVVIILLSVYIR